jgi:hypothetical protein
MADTDSPVKTLRCFGESLWLDFIQRSLVREGELAAMMQR